MLRKIGPNDGPVSTRRSSDHAKAAFSFDAVAVVSHLAGTKLDKPVEDWTQQGNPFKSIFEQRV